MFTVLSLFSGLQVSN